MKLSNIASRKNRILLRELVVTDFKLRYQGSVLGYAWSVLKPLFLFVILYIVFEKFLRLGRDIEHFPVYLLLGVVLWGFFTEATIQGLQSIVSRGDLIRKINFPKYIIVISGTVSALINLAINMIVVFIFSLLNGVVITFDALLVFPLLIELYVFSLGIAFFLAAINTKYRDVGYLWEIFLQAAFYATPVLYPLQMVIKEAPAAAGWIMLNPVAQVIQDVRHVLVTNQAVTLYQVVADWRIAIPFILIGGVVMMASYYFRSTQKYFAEMI
ncbi:ABC transporter permease [Candidatus Saccharibacteria bacterium]|nr:MAG: ABC transporter permease [Candidatus Saccharibacteria bacterium]QQS71012.1 MAG: ABC transporter permease [Candidatus Saccharibacteria bacterium]